MRCAKCGLNLLGFTTCQGCGHRNGDASCSAPAAGCVPFSELTKLLDVWGHQIGAQNLRTDYDRGMEKGFQICADGLRRKMEQNDLHQVERQNKETTDEK